MKLLAYVLCLWRGVCLSCLFLVHAAGAAPCTVANSGCTEWMKMPGERARFLVYRTYSLEARNEEVVRALVIVHGQARDADHYFSHVLEAATRAGVLANTLIVAPRFASRQGRGCVDVVAADELTWNCQQVPEGWRVGGAAINNDKISSFDVADEILRKLARKEIFPNLKTIVIAGHSAGGQFVTRYEMVNQVHEHLGIPVTYVVANPSSYAYPDSLRPLPHAVSSRATSAMPDNIAPALFVPFADAGHCSEYDHWPYGLQNRIGYAAKLTEDQLKTQFAARKTIYLLGARDVEPINGFDASCPANAQGPNRLARGMAFTQYVSEKYKTAQKTIVVPFCGHDARCMFIAEPVLPLIFPE